MKYIGIFLYLSVNLYKFMKNGGIFITMNNAEKKAFPIYNQRLAGFLMMSGYRLMGVEENEKYKGKNVFYFMESKNIRSSIQDYFGNVK